MLPDILEKLWALELKDWSPQVLQSWRLAGQLAGWLGQSAGQPTSEAVGP